MTAAAVRAPATTESPRAESSPNRVTDLGDCRHWDSAAFSAESCLDQLARASSDRVEAFAGSLDADGDDASALCDALTDEGDAADAASWWASLDELRRVELVTDLPGVIGNIEGVPYAVRDGANRIFLATATDDLRDRIATGRDGAQGDDTSRLAMLDQVQAALGDRTTGDAARHLVALDTVMPGRAAISVGDLDTADDVNVLVPGMLFAVTGQMVDWTSTAGSLYDEQQRFVVGLSVDRGSRLATTATVAWMGYRTPDLMNFFTLDLAHRGAVRLEHAVLGLDAVRATHPARVTVMAHSYGSTTATIALSSGRITVDSLVLLGSPGSITADAADLSVRGHDVYAAAGSFDPVAGSGFFGVDPGSAAFGAVLLHTGGGRDTLTGQALGAALGHNDYFRPGTESMKNLALIGLGRGDLVDDDQRTPGDHGPEAPSLALVRPQDLYLAD
ncbi:alpha/beta hydrolase [Frigoribacterium sp. 2-23]|uniref:alpha/beta hydrolase n=1 Tax=Frigoribacterium sp. 2-23 TaxID=3415006 RepID=UPI003C6F1BEC